jgi:hypothetical protein
MKAPAFIRHALASLCQKAKGAGRKCVICTVLAGLCQGANTAFANEQPCERPRGNVQVVKVVKSPMTLMGDIIGRVTGKTVPCPQGVMMKVADASDTQVTKALEGNPYAAGRVAKTHQYR